MKSTEGGRQKTACSMLRLLALLLSLAGPPSLAGDDLSFCALAQGMIASTELVPDVIVHTDHEAFVESKPSDKPFIVHQYSSAPRADEPAINTVISCKMRTSERINHSHGDDGKGLLPAGAETSCDEIHRQMLESVLAEIPDEVVRLGRERWVIEPEDTRFIGPRWLQPWPFTAVSRSADGLIHLHTRALYSPHSWWMPMPERFLGNYYCHLVNPEYLRALVAGEIQLP